MQAATRACSVSECGESHLAKGLCRRHYKAQYQRKDDGRICAIDGCGARFHSAGLCAAHYARESRAGRITPKVRGICSVDGCGRPHDSKGLCSHHYSANYHKGNAAHINERHKKTYHADPAKRLAMHTRWRRRNLKRDLEHVMKWQRKNPDRVRIYRDLRRVRKHGAAGRHTAAEVAELRRLQKNRCAVCKTKLRKTHKDHIVPLVRGGSNDIGNIQLLCPSCNCSKQGKDPIVFMQTRGLLL